MNQQDDPAPDRDDDPFYDLADIEGEAPPVDEYRLRTRPQLRGVSRDISG